MFLNARQLQKEVIGKERRRQQELYAIHLERCCSQIRDAHSSGKDFTMYTVPMVMLDEPHYGYVACIDFLKAKLKEGGFYRRVLKPGNLIFISWDTRGKEDIDTSDNGRDFMEVVLDVDDPQSAERVQRLLNELKRRP